MEADHDKLAALSFEHNTVRLVYMRVYCLGSFHTMLEAGGRRGPSKQIPRPPLIDDADSYVFAKTDDVI